MEDNKDYCYISYSKLATDFCLLQLIYNNTQKKLKNIYLNIFNIDNINNI